MNYKLRKLITNWRVILLIAFLLISVIAIQPTLSKGAAIRNVITNSSASLAGIPQPKPSIQPVNRERIIAINNAPVNTVDDYYKYVSALSPNRTITVKTNKAVYKIVTQEKFEANVSKGVQDLGLRVYEAPTTNIRKGLDLQGGTRVLLQPEAKLNQDDLSTLIDNMKQRLNVYGLSDIVIRDASDLERNQYIIVEIAGATEEEIKDLLAKQGKFEAKIGNKTVFRGGQDITYVGRSAQDARIEDCGPASSNQWSCRYSIVISLSQAAAQRQADATRDLSAVSAASGTRGCYLNEKIEFYLDDKFVEALDIACDLKGKAETQIVISGPGIGTNQQDAAANTQAGMKRMQTILITGSLPVKLNIVKTDSISPVLGEQFINNSILMSFLAILSVAIVLGIRYKRIIIAIPILITMLSEVVILLGAAAVFKQNMDLAAIAGILVAIGTGVDDQIVITDETLKGETTTVYNWKEKVKRAFSIIMLAYLTVVVAMIPLIFAGAGLLKGFAITTIIGVTIGVFITRPAYSAFVELMLK